MFVLNLVTPEKRLATELEVDEVIVPGERGQLTLLPGHTPLITTLGVGTVKYRAKGQSQYHSAIVSWGYCEVNPRGVNVLAETAESIEEVDRERATEALKKAQKMLTEPNLEANQIQKYQRKLKRALARLEANKTAH
ncbi:MAG: ATP synthase F1 subunit epsilon [Bdellovibrionales bacterium]